jgi:hypothetical protein
MTYLAILVQIKLNMFQAVPDAVVDALEEYADIIPSGLLKKLPPKKAIDHKIGLIQKAIPPAQAPYRMHPI